MNEIKLFLDFIENANYSENISEIKVVSKVYISKINYKN